MTRRLLLYVIVLVLVAVLAVGLTYFGLRLCAPADLPGDENWMMRRRLLEALTVLSGGRPACFAGPGAGSGVLMAGIFAAALLIPLVLAMLAWELIGRPARLAWLRARGGHSILAGSHDDLKTIAQRQRASGPVLFLASTLADAVALTRTRPFAEVGLLGRRRRIRRQLERMGAGSARTIVAATNNDLANLAMAELALNGPGKGDLLVRLEEGSVRALSSSRLGQLANEKQRRLSVLSLTHLQAKRGLVAAMPGHYTIEGRPRSHVAICGSGIGLQTIAFEIARQGYGFDPDPPVISLIRTGATDFSAGMLERLVQSGAADVRVASVSLSAPGALDGAIYPIAGSFPTVAGGEITFGDPPPLLAVHCISDNDAEAEEMALRWERVLVRQGLFVPPIVAYTSDDRAIGSTGMVRTAIEPDLADAEAVERLIDKRAISVHNRFYEAQKLARGAAFGSSPAEVPWEQLADAYREENRNVIDQMDYKLALVNMVLGRGQASAEVPQDAVETLAEVAHARWLVSKALSGWRYGSPRDNVRLLHPDMLPYAQLDEPAKQKDRDEVATLGELAAASGETLRAERRVAIARPLEGA
ncbi:MAG: RyR domain-containing protein, partial [Devosia sp.]